MPSIVSYTHILPGGSLGVVKLSHITETATAPMKVEFDRDSEFLGLVFNLNSEIDFSWTNTDQPGSLARDHFNLFYLPQYSCLKYELKEGIYGIFVVEFAPAFLERWVSSFSIIDHVKNSISRKVPCTCTASIIISAEVHELLKDLIKLKIDDIDSKIHDTVALCLRDIASVIYDFGNLLYSESSEMTRVRDLLLRDLSKRWTTDLLLFEVGIGRTRLFKEFKRIFGIPVFEFLYEERMKKASTLISDTNMPLKQIARAVGYRNESNFSQAFKKKFGFAPGRLRYGYGETTQEKSTKT